MTLARIGDMSTRFAELVFRFGHSFNILFIYLLNYCHNASLFFCPSIFLCIHEFIIMPLSWNPRILSCMVFAFTADHTLLKQHSPYVYALNVQQQALTVLEYLVAHGSERVIGEIREHTHQISVSSLLLILYIYKLLLSS